MPKPAEVEITVDTSLYPLEVIFRVCYVFTDRCYLWLHPSDGGMITVVATPKSDGIDIRDLQGEFGNALIDYAVRRNVARETREIRDQLVKTALAEALGGSHSVG